MSETRLPTAGASAEPSRRARHALDALNFTLADVRDGLGPYLAIYLIAVRGPGEGWNEATAGFIMTLAGIAGLIAQTPAGALIDRTRHKRLMVGVAALVVTLCSVRPPSRWPTPRRPSSPRRWRPSPWASSAPRPSPSTSAATKASTTRATPSRRRWPVAWPISSALPWCSG